LFEVIIMRNYRNIKKFILCFLLALIHFSGFGSDNTLYQLNSSGYKQGEELVYMLSYGFIHGGNASIKLGMTEYQNKKVFHAKLVAKTIGITDKIFRIEDIYESYFDTNTCLPYKSVRNIREGNYKYYDEVIFMQRDCTIYSQKSGKLKVPPNILDIVSSLFYLRRMNIEKFKKNEVITFVTYFGDEIFPFPLRFRGKEIIKTKLGLIECYRFDPVVEVGRIFESEDDMTFWITADKNQIPIKIRMELVVGAVYCDLIEYKNILQDFRLLE
jgi:hypothetical protein